MTWQQWKAACQVVAEEKIGAPLRAQQRAEEAEYEATKEAIRRTMPTARPDADPQTEQARLRTIQPRPITDEIVGA